MKLFDTHAHLDGGDPADFHRRALAGGVDSMLISGADIETSFAAMEFASAFGGAWFSAGIHPHDAGEDFSRICGLLGHARCVAVGETGLDYYYELSDRRRQRPLLEISLQAALRLGLPAVIHCRDKEGADGAYADCHAILRDFSLGGGRFVMHCFTGSRKWLDEFLLLGAYIGFGGIITFSKGENVRELLRATPEDRILFETDSPYLAPAPFRGKPNHPEYLPFIVEKAAGILGRDVEDLAAKSVDNSFAMFTKAERH